MTPDQLATRRRLAIDFEYYCKHCVKIRTKESKIENLRLNKVQQRLLAVIEKQQKETGKVRVVILKARQQGLSTATSAYLYKELSHNKAKKGLVVAHSAETTRSIFDMYKRIHAEMPSIMKPSTKYSSRKEMVFDKLDSAFIVATAGNDTFARGETLTHCHVSEMAFWNKAYADDNFGALMQSVPDTTGTAIIIESTANGMSGPFFDIWCGAVAGENGFVPFFSPWFDSPDYQLPVIAKFDPTLEEEDLIKKYDLTPEQLLFRRQRIVQSGKDTFEQEYPSNADEAFKSSGRPVFNPVAIHKLLEKAPGQPPYPLMDFDIKGEISEQPRGRMKVYQKLDKTETYTIGADVAGGQAHGDHCVAQILNSKREQVAIWRGQVDPAHYAKILIALGTYFNKARVAVESNNHGLSVVTEMRRLRYSNLYYNVVEGEADDAFTEKMGFRTTSASKHLIIDRMTSALAKDEIKIVDRVTLQEMLTYVFNENGKMGNEPGCFDDCVMSLAIANHLLAKPKGKPIIVPEYMYEEAY